MDWSEFGKTISTIGLPLLGGMFGGPLGASAGTAVAAMIAKETDAPADNPDALLEGLNANPEAVANLKALELEKKVVLQELLIQKAQNEQLHKQRMAVEGVKAAAAVNATMRKELVSNDGFVRRSRPAMLYVFGFSVMLEIIFAGLVFWFRPDQSGNLTAFFAALAAPQMMLLRAVGVWVQKRTEEKAMSIGMAAPSPVGMVQAITQAIKQR